MKLKLTLLILISFLIGCSDDSSSPTPNYKETQTEANSESCTWTYQVEDNDSGEKLDYGTLCLQTEKGLFPEGSCAELYKAEKGDLCPSEEVHYTCENLKLDDLGTTGAGYINSLALKNLLESTADLGGESVCDLFLQAFDD